LCWRQSLESQDQQACANRRHILSLVVQEYSRHTLREAFGCSNLIIAAAKMQGVNSQLQGVNSQLQGVNSQLQSSYHRCCEDAGCEFSVAGCDFSVAVILSSLLRRCRV
jgi:hypothetical protein